MSDIFREVDEEIRHERYKKLWDRFGLWLILAAVLVVAGTAGYRGWQYWQGKQAAEAGDLFLQAITLSNEGKQVEAQELFGRLESATGGYPMLARMRAATSKAEAGDVEAALAEFDAIAADGSLTQLYRDIAALRAAYLAMDTQDYAAMEARLSTLAEDGNQWRFLAREALAFSAWKAGDIDATRRWLDGIVAAEGAPAEVVGRANLLLDLVNASQGAPKEGSNS